MIKTVTKLETIEDCIEALMQQYKDYMLRMKIGQKMAENIPDAPNEDFIDECMHYLNKNIHDFLGMENERWRLMGELLRYRKKHENEPELLNNKWYKLCEELIGLSLLEEDDTLVH